MAKEKIPLLFKAFDEYSNVVADYRDLILKKIESYR
jgi:hypothetical protein